MGKQAVVRGEIHLSTIDRKALLNRDLGSFDALYRERMPDEFRLQNPTIGYVSFLIGYLSLEFIYLTSSMLRRWICPLWGYDIEAVARQNGLDVRSETDLEFRTLYETVDDEIVYGFLGLFVTLISLTFWVGLAGLSIHVPLLDVQVPFWILSPITLVLFPPGFFSLVLLFGVNRERDEKMSSVIDAESRSLGHDRILVLVGDVHVDRIRIELEALGWEVTTERSSHPIPRLTRLLTG
jgi:hypothetical protein